MTRLDVDEAAAFLRSKIGGLPRIALVLGSGLGGLADEIEEAVVLPYADIPHFPVSTAPGHEGRLVAGTLAGKAVLVMQGRFHYYEGHSLDRISFPIRTFSRLGIGKLILTNAAGGVNRDFRPGDFMVISDHINFTGQNPLIGANDEAFGPRFPDMSHAYDRDLRSQARKVGRELGISLREGVYIWFTGPSYESPAEIRAARLLGADAVGMSTVPEAICAVHAGMRVLGISCITNMAAGILDQPITGEEVLEISKQRKPDFVRLVRRLVELEG